MISNMEIRYVDGGLANNFGNYLEINKHLKKYPSLLNPILIHELDHTDETFTIQDLYLDLSASYNINQFELIKFMVKHPRSFSQLLPVYYSKTKGWVYDINLSLSYITFISFISVAILMGVYLI